MVGWPPGDVWEGFRAGSTIPVPVDGWFVTPNPGDHRECSPRSLGPPMDLLRKRIVSRTIYIVLFFLMVIYLVAFFELAPFATIGSCGDFCDTWSMYFFMLHPFFDVLKVFEQVNNVFEAHKVIRSHENAPPRSVYRPSPCSNWIFAHRSATVLSWTDGCGCVPDCLKLSEIAW